MKKIITIAFILFLSYNGWAEDEQSIQKTKIKNLEKEIIELKKEIKIVDKEYKIRETDLKDYIQTKYLNWYASNFFSILAIFGVFGTIIGIIGLRNYLRAKIDKNVQLQLGTYLGSAEWTNALKVKINKQLEQNKLKDRMKIIVLSSSGADIAEMTSFLKENEFKSVNYYFFNGHLIEDSKMLNDNPQILIINNQANQFNLIKPTPSIAPYTNFDDLINEIKKHYKTLAIFYFNDTGDNLPRNLNDGLISSFANSYASFYHNILDLMRYKYLVIDKKEF